MAQYTVVLGVTGGIAAYKAADVASKLVRQSIQVHPVMTANACKFIAPLTFQTLCSRPVVCGMFDEIPTFEVEHIALARRADLVAILPATANCVGKLANGLADDFLTTLCLATQAPLLVCPAMNSVMYASAAVQQNLRTLRQRGVHILEPDVGVLACGESGAGRLPDTPAILAEMLRLLEGDRQDYAGKRVLVTAGPTRESIDPVRYISNKSSGKMGYAVAQAALDRGAQVTLISGPVRLPVPRGAKVIQVTTTRQMLAALLDEFDHCDMVVKAAAPADFGPVRTLECKLKKKDMGDYWRLDMKENPDMLELLGQRKAGQVLVGFAAETDHLIENAREKLLRKNLDMIVANDVSDTTIGFDSDDNAVTLCTRDGKAQKLPKDSKRNIAHAILDAAIAL